MLVSMAATAGEALPGWLGKASGLVATGTNPVSIPLMAAGPLSEMATRMRATKEAAAAANVKPSLMGKLSEVIGDPTQAAQRARLLGEHGAVANLSDEGGATVAALAANTKNTGGKFISDLVTTQEGHPLIPGQENNVAKRVAPDINRAIGASPEDEYAAYQAKKVAQAPASDLYTAAANDPVHPDHVQHLVKALDAQIDNTADKTARDALKAVRENLKKPSVPPLPLIGTDRVVRTNTSGDRLVNVAGDVTTTDTSGLTHRMGTPYSPGVITDKRGHQVRTDTGTGSETVSSGGSTKVIQGNDRPIDTIGELHSHTKNINSMITRAGGSGNPALGLSPYDAGLKTPEGIALNEAKQQAKAVLNQHPSIVAANKMHSDAERIAEANRVGREDILSGKKSPALLADRYQSPLPGVLLNAERNAVKAGVSEAARDAILGSTEALDKPKVTTQAVSKIASDDNKARIEALNPGGGQILTDMATRENLIRQHLEDIKEGQRGGRTTAAQRNYGESKGGKLFGMTTPTAGLMSYYASVPRAALVGIPLLAGSKLLQKTVDWAAKNRHLAPMSEALTRTGSSEMNRVIKAVEDYQKGQQYKMDPRFYKAAHDISLIGTILNQAGKGR
jgi:hypothetical protein